MKNTLFKKGLVIGIIILFVEVSVLSSVSSTGNIAIESNPSDIYYKMDPPTVLLDENFSGTFPPDGWETGFFSQNNSTCCDSEPPCARGEYSGGYYDNFMKSKAIDASNYEKCIIKFYFGAKAPYPSYRTAFLKYRRNETSPWIDITPWTNPIDDVCDYYEIEITYDSEGCGEALQILWQYLGWYYYDLPNLCIDDVEILGIPINNPPTAPTIDGPPSGRPGIEYEYTFNSTDFDDDPVMYFVDWGDNDTDWTEYGDSGEEITLKHIWENKGNYTIKAKAIDINGAESDWSEFTVTMPRDKVISNTLLRLLERYPLLNLFLQRLTFL